MHVVLPLFPAVLAIHHGEYTGRCSLYAADCGCGGLDEVDVPDAAHHGLELLVRVDEGALVVVVAEELVQGH